ncbi:MAG: hypothetical protein AB7S38_08885 [Vulcanimicrobiota bacterium]
METLFARFKDVDLAVKAVGALIDHGVKEEHLDLIADTAKGQFLVEKKHSDAAKKATDGVTTTTAADALEGAKEGGLAGLALGAVAGLASLIIPGFGIVLGGGAVATAIGAAIGTGVAGAAAGGVAGYLKDMGVEEAIARDYGKVIEEGGAVVSVTLPSGKVDEAKARMLLSKYRADHLMVRQTAAIR